MPNTTFYSLLACFIFAFGFSSCNEKIDINADYDVTPVIFGLLDHHDSIHYVKITKTFLGEGNNYDFAKVPDSSYFTNVEAKVIELLDGEKTGREWMLKDSTINTKKDGIFYNPEQRVYVFYEKNLLEDHEYKLEAILNEGQYMVDATTALINGFKYNSPITNPNYFFTFGNKNGSNINYQTRFVNYSEGFNGLGYQTRLIIKIKEKFIDGSEEIKEIVWSAETNNGKDVNDVKPDNPQSSESISFSGQEFFNVIAGNIDENPDVDSRQFVSIDIVTEVGHSELMKYIDVSKPNSGIAQSVQLYTNINGGLGLFSSRHIARKNNVGISPSTIQVLCQVAPTNTLKFCSTDPSHIGELFYCF